MAPSADDHVGPHPSYIEVAKPYIFDYQIASLLSSTNITKEDTNRLQGVAWIDNVRKALQLPVRTFNTAVVYYHKFRLLHPDHEYNFADAAAAALFTACKIEDTLKKSREILCASWNLKGGEWLSPDDARFDSHSKSIIGLERLMLESAGFDFRNRHPQKLVIKLVKQREFPKYTVGKTAYNMSLDLYRTFAPLKQTTSTMAIACVELACRLHEQDLDSVCGESGFDYKYWCTSRAEIMETLLDLLDLYINHRTSTTVGPPYTLETFINLRIVLNNEATASDLPRHTPSSSSARETNGTSSSSTKDKPRNGVVPPSPMTPLTPAAIQSPGQNASAIGIRGQNGTVRFMLDPARAAGEKKEVDRYWRVEEEEYEVEVTLEPERRNTRR